MQKLTIESVDVDEGAGEALSYGLSSVARLNDLSFLGGRKACRQLGAAGVAAMAHALASGGAQLQHLDLRRASAGSACCVQVLQRLATQQLTRLDLSYNSIRCEYEGLHVGSAELQAWCYEFGRHPGAQALAAQLGSNCPLLQALDLTGNIIGTSGARALALVASGCTGLTSLMLSDNGIGTTGALHLAEIPRWGCQQLQVIDLSQNPIGAKGAGAVISRFCTGSKSMCNLQLSCTGVKADEAAEVVEAIAGSAGHCTCLIELNLGANELGQDGCIAVARAAASWSSLIKLSLSDNGVVDETAVQAAVSNERQMGWRALEVVC